MDSQQNDKECLAAYIHRFKREAKRCNFTNNAATIRIFVKDLKNTHTLAACFYEKEPQTLTDAISEVENLKAAQQLTTMLLSSSTVNVMTSEGINASSVRSWAILHVIALIYIVLNAMSMVT